MSQFRLSRRPDIGDKIRVSFEFFPPKTDEMEQKLWETVKRLKPSGYHRPPRGCGICGRCENCERSWANALR